MKGEYERQVGFHECHNPNLGLAIKARVYKVVGQEGS